jgi:pimeloyl-ACP methyl ester carboxylesterase
MNEIFFRKSGQGKAVVLIHGFCETHEIWNGLIDSLSEKFEVYAIDLPGFGQSQLPLLPFSIDDIAEQILRWMEEKEIIAPAVIGHSLGGYVALAMAGQGSNRIGGLGLFHSTPLPDGEQRKINRNKVMEFVKRNGVDPFVDTFVPGLFFDRNDPSIPEVDKIARKTSKEALLGYTTAMRDRPSTVPVLMAFEKPVLVLSGDNDSIIPIEQVGEFGHLAKKSMLRILKNTGHMAMFEQPEMANDILTDFISSV